MQRSRPVLIALGIIAGSQAFMAYAGASDWMSDQVISIVNGVIAAAVAVTAIVLSGTNVEAKQVVATQPVVGGDVIAGPRSSFTTGAAIEPQNTVGEIT